MLEVLAVYFHQIELEATEQYSWRKHSCSAFSVQHAKLADNNWISEQF
jgi:hypothetical protein